MALTIPKSFSGTPASIKSQAEALLARATTVAEINNIVATARSSNVTLDSARVGKAKDTIAQATAKAKAAADKAAADKAIADKAAAAKAATDKALAAQKLQQERALKATADRVAAEKAAEKAAADRAAAEAKTTADNVARTAAAVAKQQAEDKAMADKAVAARTATPEPTQSNVVDQRSLRNDFINNVINKRTATQQQVDDYVKAITNLGGTPDAVLLKQAQSLVVATARQAEQAQQQAQQEQARQQTQQKIATYREQLQQATTTQQIQDITAQLKKAEIDPDALKYSGLQGIADRQNVILGRQEYEATQQAERAAQTAQREAEAAKKLQEQQQKLAEGKITMAKAVQDFEKNLPTATSLQDLKPNKRFMFKDSQGMADSIDNPAADKTYTGNLNNRVGPDGHLYLQMPPDYATGQQGYWVKSLEPETLAKSRHNLLFQPIGTDFQFEKPAAFVNVIGQGKINSQASLTKINEDSFQIINNHNIQVRAQQAAAEKAGGYNFFGSLGLKFVDDFVEDTIGWGTIATIAGGMIGGPWGATMANAAVGVVENRSLEDVIKGAALTFAMSYGTQALTRAIGETVAQGVNTGVIDATDDILSFSDNIGTLDEAAGIFDQTAGLGELPQSVIDQAMATSDPVAALNAANGFGDVDLGYLESIGAGDDLLAVADAHSTVNAATGGSGYEFVGSEYSNIPEELVAPPAEVAGPVAPVEQFGPPAEVAVEPVAPGAPVAGTPGTEGFTQAELNAATYDPTAPLPPGTQYASTDPTGTVTTSQQLTTDQYYQRFLNEGMNPTQAYEAAYGTTPPTGFGPQQLAEETLLNMAPTTTPVAPDVINPGAGISTPGAVIPNIPTEVLVGAPLVIGGAIAAGGGGGGGAAATTAPVTPTPVQPPVVQPPPVVEPPPVVQPPTPVQPPVVQPPPVTPTPVQPPVVQPPPAPVQPPVQPPPVVEPPPVVQPPPAPVQPPVVQPPTPVQPPPVVEPPPVQPPVQPPVEPPPVQPPVEPPPVEPPPVEPPPVEPAPTTPPTTEAPVIDYSTPYEGAYSDQSVLQRYLEGKLSFDNITGLIAAGLVLPSVLGLLAGAPQPTIRRPNYGPIPPINWGAAGNLVMPGVNPGFVINPAQEPFYQTTDPVQAKYAYTQRPLVTRPEDVLSTYQDRQYAPAVPFGLRQGQQQYDLAQLLNQINQQPLDPNFVGFSNYPTQAYQPPIFNPGQAVNQAQYIPTGVSTVMTPIQPT